MSKQAPLNTQLLRINDKLQKVRKRFEDNYPKYSCKKYEEKRDLYIRLTKAQSALTRILDQNEDTLESKIRIIRTLTSEIQFLETRESSLLARI